MYHIWQSYTFPGYACSTPCHIDISNLSIFTPKNIQNKNLGIPPICPDISLIDYFYTRFLYHIYAGDAGRYNDDVVRIRFLEIQGSSAILKENNMFMTSSWKLEGTRDDHDTFRAGSAESVYFFYSYSDCVTLVSERDNPVMMCFNMKSHEVCLPKCFILVYYKD